MSYDANLTPLFNSCDNPELDPIVQYLLRASTNLLDVSEQYKRAAGDHRAYLDVIVREIRDFGGNSLVNVFRGDGVEYAEIVRDVADKIDADYGKQDSVEEVERKVLVKIFSDSVDRMTPEQRRDLEEEFRRAGAQNVSFSSGVPAGVVMAQLGVQMTGFMAYRVAVIVANAIAKAILGQGLSFAANAALTRAIAIAAGPVGWVVSGLWTAIDLAGPAYRVTIPVVCHVAFLRQKKQFEAIGNS